MFLDLLFKHLRMIKPVNNNAYTTSNGNQMFILYTSSPGGGVCPLTLCGELFQVLQSYFFVSRAVCQPVIDHRVLTRDEH